MARVFLDPRMQAMYDAENAKEKKEVDERLTKYAHIETGRLIGMLYERSENLSNPEAADSFDDDIYTCSLAVYELLERCGGFPEGEEFPEQASSKIERIKRLQELTYGMDSVFINTYSGADMDSTIRPLAIEALGILMRLS